MNKKLTIFSGIIILLAAGTAIYLRYPPNPASLQKNNVPPAQTTEKGNADIIKVSDPLPEAVIKNPLIVRGEARGQWFFEASFPVKIFDENGT